MKYVEKEVQSQGKSLMMEFGIIIKHTKWKKF